ncbi:MAG: hypothetical protein KF878_01110 [Planctomycetes bacterium]|nr:hypothetical protein [Planctomycetota bacterium]MCW8137616.1 hypothetical protein [Planctomycetota bacterium]
MRRWLAWVGGLGCLMLALAFPSTQGPVARAVAQDRHGGSHGGPATDVGALFRQQCASCHVTPDPGVATDRAYIRQLQETA